MELFSIRIQRTFQLVSTLNELTGRHASFHFVQMLFHIYGYTNGFCNFCLHNLESFRKCKGGPAQPFCAASIFFSVDFCLHRKLLTIKYI